VSEECKSYAEVWVERYRTNNPESAREIESRCNRSSYPLRNNTNHQTTAEQSKNRGYAWTEGSSMSSYGINPVVESAILVRKELRLTQAGFARCLNISPRTLRDWEQGRRHPSGAALTLLQWVVDQPDYISRLHKSMSL